MTQTPETTRKSPAGQEATRAGFPPLGMLPPHIRVLFLLLLPRGTDAVTLAAELNIADHLAEAPRTASELAELTGCHEDSLRRILLTAASLGVFAQQPDGRFVLTPDAHCLRADADFPLRDLAVYFGNLDALNGYDELRETVRTGVDAFHRKFGKQLYEGLADYPELSQTFNRAMNQTTRLSAGAVAEFGDFKRFTTVADIGGGQGQLIGEIVGKHPELRGFVFDLPHVAKGAPAVLAKLGVADRVTVVSGDLLRDDLPAGADAYLFHRVLGGWDDPRIVETLIRVRSQIQDRPDARVILVDQIVPEANVFHPGRLFDVEFMVHRGGRVRTEADWRQLIAAAGLEFVGAHQANPVVTMLEARPAASS